MLVAHVVLEMMFSILSCFSFLFKNSVKENSSFLDDVKIFIFYYTSQQKLIL